LAKLQARVEWVLFVWIMTGYIELESESNAWIGRQTDALQRDSLMTHVGKS